MANIMAMVSVMAVVMARERHTMVIRKKEKKKRIVFWEKKKKFIN